MRFISGLLVSLTCAMALQADLTTSAGAEYGEKAVVQPASIGTLYAALAVGRRDREDGGQQIVTATGTGISEEMAQENAEEVCNAEARRKGWDISCTAVHVFSKGCAHIANGVRGNLADYFVAEGEFKEAFDKCQAAGYRCSRKPIGDCL